ncbi:MAG: helix-turn-helix domain-containing protein [Cetobacterium sp.]
MSKFSEYLKKFLDEREMKLEYFADKVGVSFGLVGHYTNGRRSPSYKFLEKFFKAFDINEGEQSKIMKMVELDKMPESLRTIKRNETIRRPVDPVKELERAIYDIFYDDEIPEEIKKDLKEKLDEAFFMAKMDAKYRDKDKK